MALVPTRVTSGGNRTPFSLSSIAVVAGAVAVAALLLTFAARTRSAIAQEITETLQNLIYRPIARADGQAQSLASNAEMREGITERNQIKLTRAIRQTLPQMGLRYAGVLLLDGSPYFWFPDHERKAPIVARRLPIEYELRTVGFLEYGVMLTDDFLRELGDALSTDVRLAAGQADDPPADGEILTRIAGVAEPGYAYLRRPGDASGPPAAVLEFGVPADSPATNRLRRQRNLLLAFVAGAVLAAGGYDLRRRRQPPQTPAVFTPIQNPYIVGNPIRTPEMFFGREDDFQFARQKLVGERAGIVLVFCGERRSGKTSMLFQVLSGRLGPEFLPVLIDMQYFAAISSDQDFYESVVRETARAVYPEPEQASRRKGFAPEGDGAAQSFEGLLDEALSVHPDKTFLFLFDEYEILEAKIERGELSPMVIPYLAGLLERKRRISFIFTGSRTLEERPTAQWRVMLGKSQYRKISYLTPADTERLITRPVAGRVRYEPEAIATIVRLTNGQPFYVQVICQNLVDHLNEAKRETVTSSDVSTIVDAIVDNPLPQMIYFWDSLPPEQKLALSLLAETLTDPAGWGSPDDILSQATAQGVPAVIDLTALRFALERLFEAELLAKSAERTFRYRIDLLRHWIRRTHSIWQVVKEAGSVRDARR